MVWVVLKSSDSNVIFMRWLYDWNVKVEIFEYRFIEKSVDDNEKLNY